MNRFLLRLAAMVLLLLAGGGVRAQMYFTTGGTSSNIFPLASTTNKVQWIYITSDFNQAPMAGLITKIYFKTTTAAASGTTFTNFTVKLGTNPTPPPLLTGNWYAPMTTVFSSPSYVIPGPIAANQFVGVTLQTPFFWDGVSNLMFEMTQDAYTVGLSLAQNSNGGNRRLYGTTSATTGTASTGLVDFGVDMIPAAANNASANSITEPVNFCPGTYPLKLKIKNNGSATINTVKIDWILDGVAQPQINYSGPAIAPATAPPANEAIVTLGNVTFNATAYRTIKAWVSLPNGVQDQYPADDTLNVTMHSALNGTYTIGGTAPDFTTLAAAATALNTFGVCGPVTMNIRGGTYTNDQANLNAIAGTSAVNRITFKPETSSASVTFNDNNATAAANYVFNLNGTSYVTIKDLNLNATNATYSKVISLNPGCAYDSILNCSMSMAASTALSSDRCGVFLSGHSGPGYLVIKGNTITNASYAMYFWGSSTTALSTNNLIDSNTIVNPYYMGIYAYYQGNTRISNNILTSTATPYSTLYCFYTPYNQDGCELSGNKITVTGAASVYGIYRYFSNGAATAHGRVFNNVVNISGTGSIYGLDLYYSNYQDVLNNTVSISSTGATAYAGYLYCTSSAYTNNNVNNNIFFNAGTTGTALYNYNPQFALSDYNNAFGGANLFQSIVPSLTTNSLASWRTTAQSDRNSLCYRPGFISATNLAPNPADTAVWSIHGRGIQMAGNDRDVTGAVRPTTLAAGVPDLGAYEFVPTVAPPLALATPAVAVPGSPQAFTFGQDTVALLSWAAASTVATSLAVRQYSGIVPGSLPAGSFMYFYTDVALSGTGLSYDASIFYKDPWKGTSPINESAIRMATKNGSAAWISYPGAGSTVDINRNVLSVAGMTTSNWYTGRVDNCTGAPTAPVITNTPVNPLSPLCVGQSAYLNAADNTNMTAGIIYRWQSAPSATGPWSDIAGATGLSYTTPGLTATTWYRIVDTCAPSGQGAASAAYQVPVANPQLTGTTAGSRCGPGTVNLSATGGATTSLRWYTAATGGTLLFNGANFTTPYIVSTTTYYVEAYEGLCIATPRVAVTATVTPGPAFNATDSIVVCNNAPAMLTITTPTANYNNFIWSPNTNLFTDAAGTIPYTGTSATTVYLKTNVSNAYTVYVNALNNGSQCTAADTVKVYVLPDSSTVSITGTPDTICISGTTVLKLNPISTYGAGLVRWYKSQNGTSFSLISGATAPTYTTGTIASDTFFRAQALNTAGDICISKNKFIYRNNPLVLTTVPGTRCGPGTVTLAATGSPSTILNWYAAATGGLSLGAGNNFVTPILPATTTYYVSATSGPSVQGYNAGIVNSNLGNPFVTSTAGWGLIFTVNMPCTIDSVGVYPNANGTIAVNIQNATTNAVLQTSATFPVTGNGTNKVMLPVNFTMLPGTYKMGVSSYTGFTNLGNEGFGTTAFPYNSVPINITSSSQGAGAVTSTYYFFYDWKIRAGAGCESPRTAVTATITPSAFFSVTDTQSVCNNAVATMTVLSPNANYDQVTWTPIANLYTNAATTFPYAFNTNASTVYSRTTTPGYTAYVATGLNTLSNCQGMDTSVVFTQPVITSVTASPDTLCFSGSSTLSIVPSSPYFTNSLSWFNSTDRGVTYNPISGASATSYTTPVITDTTWYRIRTKNSAGAICQDFNKAMIVKIPTLLDTNNRTRCGVGPVVLDAYALPGYGVNWYTTASPATSPNPIYTGNNFTTPTLFNSTTYYVSAGSGSSGTLGLPDRVGATSNTGVGVIGLIFDVLTPMTLQSVAIYPTTSGTPGAGTVTVSVYNSANVLVPGLTATINVTSALAPGVKTVLPLNFVIPPGTGYRLGLTSVSGAVTGAVREVTTGYTYPYTLPGVASITTAVTGGTATGSYYYYFYDWKISSGCSSDRIPVTATVNPAPVVTVTPKVDSICYGQSALFTATSANPGYRYFWNPVQVPGPVLSIQPGASATYYLSVLDTSNGPNKLCTWFDTVKAVVLPNPIADVIPLSATTFCAGDSVRLKTPYASDYSYQWKRNGVNMPGALDSSVLVTAAGVYTVQVKKGTRCTTLSDPEPVVVNPLPTPTIGISNGVLFTGNYVAFQWLRNGQTILGATGQQFLPTQNGDYAVAVTDANGCSNTSSIWRVSNVGVALVNGIGGMVEISPNPTTGVLLIRAPLKVTAVVTTLDGRVVVRQSEAEKVDLRGVADGVYFLRVLDARDGTLLKSEKILKAQ